MAEKEKHKGKKGKWPTWAWYALGGGGALVVLLLVYLRNKASGASSATAASTAPLLISGTVPVATTGSSELSGTSGAGTAAEVSSLTQQNQLLAELLTGALAGAGGQPTTTTGTSTTGTGTSGTGSTGTGNPPKVINPNPGPGPVPHRKPRNVGGGGQGTGKPLSYREAYKGNPGTIRVTETMVGGGTRTYAQKANSIFTLTHTPMGSAAVAQANHVSQSHLRHIQGLAKQAAAGNKKALNRLHALGYTGG